MKKVIAFLIALLVFNSITVITKAETPDQESEIPQFSTSSKDQKQVLGYLVVDLCRNEIEMATKSYYKDAEVNGFSLPWGGKGEIVSITTDHSKGIPYVAKIILLPTDINNKYLGVDTLYFSIDTTQIQSKGASVAKLIKYEHKSPSKNYY